MNKVVSTPSDWLELKCMRRSVLPMNTAGCNRTQRASFWSHFQRNQPASQNLHSPPDLATNTGYSQGRHRGGMRALFAFSPSMSKCTFYLTTPILLAGRPCEKSLCQLKDIKSKLGFLNVKCCLSCVKMRHSIFLHRQLPEGGWSWRAISAVVLQH